MTITLNGTSGITTPEVVLDNTAADGGQVVLKSSGYSDWNWDNYSGRLRAYYGGTEYFTINSSGNVGIGTSSPSYQVSLGGTANGVRIALRNGTNEYAIGTETNELRLASYSATTFYSGGYAGTERMRIDSSGNLLVGKTATGVSTQGFQLLSTGWATFTNPDSGTQYPCAFYRTGNGAAVGYISTSSTATTYATSSDYRLKENIQPMQGALDVVAQLNPVTYTWKADGSDGQGFIAHELQAVVPDCVTGEKDAVDADGNPVYQGIDTSFLVATLTKAIQEQQEQIEQMKQEIAALKGAA